MTSIIIDGVLCVLCFMLSAVFLSGHGSALIAGYNTASNKEKEKYDSKKLCRAVGVFMLLPAVITAGLGAAGYFIETGKIKESAMLAAVPVFIILLFLGIIILNIYTNKKCKK